MKKILLTQRVDLVESYQERRDTIDQRWIALLLQCGFMPVLVPNQIAVARLLVKEVDYDGFLLTGGNTLVRYGGNAPERDEVEYLLLKQAIESGIPLLGVCRGMQVIQDYFGVQLHEVSNHVKNRLGLSVASSSRFKKILEQLDTVNSYHEFGSQTSVDELMVSAWSDDGIVMAVEHEKLPIFGQMWHSEREKVFNENELNLFRNFFSSCAKG